MESSTNSLIPHDIDSWIEIEEVRISRRVSIPHRIHFHLDSNLLQQITQIKNNQQQLSLSPKILTDLRYYALLNSPLEQIGFISNKSIKDKDCYSNSLLIFNTDYLDVDDERSPTVLQSVIDFKGQISQKIHQDLWHNPQLLEQISEAHYWLILEILSQLPFKHKNLYSWLIFISLLSLSCLPILIINYFWSLNLLENFTVFVGSLILFNIQFRGMLTIRIKAWIIRHIATGLWLGATKNRQFALYALALIA